jgi:hypothetical protein
MTVATDEMLIRLMKASGAEAYGRLLTIRTENFVRLRFRWTQIQAVANTLMEKKTLSPGELRQVYFDALGPAMSKLAGKARKTRIRAK